jgi:hypothetical protein
MTKLQNISMVNPVAPMAQESDFMSHDKTSYPFKPVPKSPKCVKVILNSGDRQAGSTLQSARFKVNLPTTFLNRRLNLVVDSFIVSSAPNSVSNLALYPYYIRFIELRNPYSYSSMTQTTSGVILLTTGTSYFNQSPREKGGMTIVDKDFFDRQFTVDFHSPHFDTTAANGISNSWSLVLSLWSDEEY